MNQEKLPKANHTCEVCGTKYYACNKCIELSKKGILGWKLTCCTKDCFQLKMLHSSFEANEVDKSYCAQFINTLSFPVEKDQLQDRYKSFVFAVEN